MIQDHPQDALSPRLRFGHMLRAMVPALLALCLAPGGAIGQSTALDACANAFDPASAIAGCSAVVDADWASDEQLRLAFNNRANARAYLGDIEDAVDDYGRALAYDPHYVNARYNRACLYLETQKFDAAIADFDAVLRLEPNRTDARNNRALALLRSGDLDGAIAGFTTVIVLDPTHAFAYNNRAVAFRRKGDTPHALADFSMVIALRPDFVGALNSRGELHAEAGRSDKAVADFRRALALQPDHAAARANLRGLLGDSSEHW